MKIPIIKYNDNLLNSLSWFMKIGGITLFPWIILRERFRSGSFYKKLAFRIINHESIHIEQQKELIIIGAIIWIGIKLLFGFGSWYIIPILSFLFFYQWYLIEWIIRLFMKGNAYKNISFEREAYANEDDADYLKTRKRFSFLKYI